MQDMEIPEFLQNYDEDSIHEEMLDLIPDEYDKSEGQHFYNFTRPTAAIVSQLRGFNIPEAIKLIWPKFSNGEYLDYHAELRNISRKEAQYATGEITFTGTPGTVIPASYTVSTESKNDIPSQDYYTLERCTIGEDGTVTVAATASVAGSDGNTASNTIVVNTTSFDDVLSVTNSAPFIGGMDEEDDESLYARISEYDKTQGDSNIGNPSDYKRWAESIPGTGTAKVIRPTDTSGLVTIVLTDGNGEPATEALCKTVYDYIISPDDENARIAPCGAFLKVIPPTTSTITVSAMVELTAGTIASVTATFAERLKEYFPTAIENKEILYQKVANILGDIEGVYDFSSLLVNNDTINIPLDDGVFPIVDTTNITLTLIE
jgi:uncharacterized phage protein gp47/JayE